MPEGAAQALPVHNAQPWYCQAGPNQQWHCDALANHNSDNLSTKVPQPLSPPTPSGSTTMPAIKPVDSVDDEPPATISPHKKLAAAEYPDHFVAVQLLAAHKPATLKDYRQRHPEWDYLQLTTGTAEKPLYLLLLGIYPDYVTAQAAISSLPPSMAQQSWIRLWGPLKQQRLSSE